MNLVLLLMSLVISTSLLQERYLFGQLAKKSLITFARLTSPAPDDHLNPRASTFDIKPHHVYVASELEKVKSGENNRLEIELPARHGKSELTVRKFVPWFIGHFPRKNVIVVTHTDQLAQEHGRDCRDVMRSGGYRLTFGDRRCWLREDSQAKDRLQTIAGGVLIFTGRGGLGAGVGGDLMVFDDFFKNSEEAQSATVRDSAYHTYVSDCQSRLNNDAAPVVMIGTRRNEDDVQGRIFDPTNMHYDASEAAKWKRIRLPGLAEAGDPMGRKPGEALWPEKFGRAYFLSRKNHASEIVRLDHETQNQCNPSPSEGVWFKDAWLKTYRLDQLPKYLRFYVASDHAYRIKQKNDKSCLLIVGIDPTGAVYILPDTFWDKVETDVLVNRMIAIMKSRRPQMWFAAKDAISGSIGPFLRTRMREEKIFTVIDEITEDVDLVRRSTSIRGRMAMGMVYWPSFAPWWPEARRQMLTFPAAHDDVVAALGILGMGMDRHIKAEGPGHNPLPKKDTWAWHTYGQNEFGEGSNTKGWS